MNGLNFTSPPVMIGAAIVVLLIVIAAAIAIHRQKKKSDLLRSRFGEEYDLAVRETGSTKKAEQALDDRLRRVENLKIRDLSVPERERYLASWNTVQSRFIDHPRGAVTEADELLNSILAARGYPSESFAQRSEDISVNHGALVGPYRQANGISIRAIKNQATTEQLRTAMIHYRLLIETLLGVATATPEQRAEVIQPLPIQRASDSQIGAHESRVRCHPG